MSLDLITTGESHGKCLNSIITDFPAGIKIDIDIINEELALRQKGFGRGGRMQIEKDTVDINSGIDKSGFSTGAPICLEIKNKDWDNWKDKDEDILTAPRPGHADLYGTIKYNHKNIRTVIERSSARETASRVAAGSIFKQYLKNFNVTIYSFTTGIECIEKELLKNSIDKKFIKLCRLSDFNTWEKKYEEKFRKTVQSAIDKKDSLGGSLRVVVEGVNPGIGSYVDYKSKLDANIAFAITGIQSVKGITFGNPDYCFSKGSEMHDEIYWDDNTYKHYTNNSGGIVGGMSTGENIYFDVFVKPVPTLMRPLKTVDINTKQELPAIKERSDVWIVPACGIVCESMTAFIIAREYSKFSLTPRFLSS